jgi:hypothetical protein
MRITRGATAIDRRGRLRRHHHGRQDRRADGAVRDDDGAVPPRTHRRRTRGRGRDVRDHGLVHARRACQRCHVRPSAGARGVPAHGGTQPPPVPHQRRLHRRIDLQRQALERVHESRTTAEWLALLRELEIPAAPLNTPGALFDDPHLAAVGMFETVDTPHGPVRFPGVPTWFSQTPGRVGGPAPELGADTAEVLAEIDASRHKSTRHAEPEGAFASAREGKEL